MGAVQSSARSSAADFANDEWKPRRALAVLIRTAIIVGPLLAGIGASRAVAGSLRRPPDLAGKALWMLIVTGFAFVAFQLARRLVERLTPLAFLLNLNLVFPDQAPSRFKTALRSESARDIERKLQQANEDEAVTLPMAAEHAQSLVGLVSQLSDHDRRTRGHSERVRAYSDIIAEQMDLSKQDRERLHWAALLHDVGKLFVDPDVLNAPGRPDEEGWKQIQGHPAKADGLLVGLKPWLGEWTRAASEHHERFDGTGYPAGLGGTDIHIGGRIVAVADAYDVMTSARSYKKSLPVEAARQELVRNAGTQFDPVVVRAFLAAGLDRKKALPGFLSSFAELPTILSNVGSTVSATTASVSIAAASVVVPPVYTGPTDALPAASTAEQIVEPVDITTTTVAEGLPSAAPEQPSNGARATTPEAPSTTAEPTTTLATTTSARPNPAAPPTTSATTTSTAPGAPTTTTPTTTTAATTTTTAAPTTTTTTTTTAAPTTTTAPSSANAVGDAATVQNSTVNIYVLLNDSFSAGYQLGSLRIVSGPGLGTASAKAINSQNAHIQYSPAGGPGVTTVVYEACDSGGDCDTATVTITLE